MNCDDRARASPLTAQRDSPQPSGDETRESTTDSFVPRPVAQYPVDVVSSAYRALAAFHTSRAAASSV
jgi:hypothetical protein